MNTIPRLPMRFRQGEVLTADKLNVLLDWMEAVQKLLPGLQVSTGPDLTFTRSGTGTVISLARGFAQRRRNAASDYEHPFKVTAAWTVNDAGAEILRVHVARGAWTNSSRINSNNFASQSVEIEASNFDLPASTKFKSVYFVCPLNYVGADEGPHFLVPDPVNECYVSPEYSDGQNWVIQLAAIEADASQKTAKVYQYWRSDITIPDMLATTN